MREAHAFGRFAGPLKIQQRDVHPVGHAVEQADLQAFALAGDPTLDQCFEDPGMRGHTAGDVAGRHAHAAGAGGVAGDHREAGFRLHQQVVRLHVGIFPGLPVAGDIDGDQPWEFGAQVLGSEPGPRRRAGGEVLDEHVRFRQDTVQQRRIVWVLDVGDEGFFAPVQPDEIR